MSDREYANPAAHAASTGQALTDAGWLDAHFEANRPEYAAMLRSVPLEPGWHALDAGCGSGGFLPLLAAAVGPAGRITALDLAPENVALVARRVAGWALPPPIEARVGTLVALPFPAARFDAVWCANATQYLTDEELAAALSEFRRVTRPGGLVAIKDTDGVGAIRIEPAPPHFMQRFAEAGRKATPPPGFLAPASARGPTLLAWLRAAGYAEAWARSTLIERWAPVRPAERAYLREALGFSAGWALGLDLPAEDLALWRELSEPAGAEAFVARPDFYAREVNVLAVGRVG